MGALVISDLSLLFAGLLKKLGAKIGLL